MPLMECCYMYSHRKSHQNAVPVPEIARTPKGPMLNDMVVRERNAKDAQNAWKAAPIFRRYLLRPLVVLRIAPGVEKTAPQLYTS